MSKRAAGAGADKGGKRASSAQADKLRQVTLSALRAADGSVDVEKTKNHIQEVAKEALRALDGDHPDPDFQAMAATASTTELYMARPGTSTGRGATSFLKQHARFWVLTLRDDEDGKRSLLELLGRAEDLVAEWDTLATPGRACRKL